MAKTELQGVLELVVLKTLAISGMSHGYEIAQRIGRASSELLRVEEGSLYPALHRMEERGWVVSKWQLTETKRKAKCYRITRSGWKRLREAQESFEQMVKGVRGVLRQ
jgi:PadR family transcriptional regulator PadR